MKLKSPLEIAKEVLKLESQAVHDQISHLDSSFNEAVQALIKVTKLGGQVVVMGIGKSGLIARKISATLSSTGTPSFFFHPTEGLHGDLGMIRPTDGVLILSSSGETDEIKKILPLLKERKLLLIALTSEKKSRLAKACDFVLCSKVKKEACPMNLTPTASTTAMLALGDAIAIALMRMKGFKASDFARLHPGGNLGKKLTLTVRELMHTGKNNPIVKIEAHVKDALIEMSRTRLGATNVVNGDGKLVGFFTDGDLRRRLQKDSDLLKKSIREVMTLNPTVITPEKNLHEALILIQGKRFDNLPVVDENGKSIGVLDERDLLAEGIV